MSIQIFAPEFRTEEILKEIRECLDAKWTGLGFKTVELEEAWKEYTGVCCAHFLNSNTSGLHLALEVFKYRYKWQENDEILTTPLTFVSTNHAILYAGLKPVFVDIDKYLCMDPEKMEKLITGKTRAVMFVGMAGSLGQYAKILRICHKHKLKIILDAAHMAGTRCHGHHVGIDADAAVFSFQAVKNLPTADSGMLCFRSSHDDRMARKLSWLGIDKDTYTRAQGKYSWQYNVPYTGYKYHGNSVIAAMGLVALKYLDQDNSYRRQLAAWYRELFKYCLFVKTVPLPENCESSTHLFQILVQDRDQLIEYLKYYDIGAGVHYACNTDYPMYADAAGTCPRAETASCKIVSLPLHINMTLKDIKHIVDKIKAYYAS